MPERWPYIPAILAIRPSSVFNVNHKGLSLYLASFKPKAGYEIGGWMGSILAALLICKFPVLDQRLSI